MFAPDVTRASRAARQDCSAHCAGVPAGWAPIRLSTISFCSAATYARSSMLRCRINRVSHTECKLQGLGFGGIITAIAFTEHAHVHVVAAAPDTERVERLMQV